MWVNFNFHFQIKSLMLLCERSWNANFMKFEPKCQKFILVSIPIIAKSIYAAKTAHKLQIWTLVENLGPKRQILAQKWTLKIMVTMATGPFMLWFCEIGPPRLSKYWAWKKLKTHYKMGLVHPGTFSQKTGLKDEQKWSTLGRKFARITVYSEVINGVFLALGSRSH